MQETLDEVQHLLSCSINSNEYNMKYVLDFCAKTAAWNKCFSEQQRLVENLRYELHATKQDLTNSEIALEREKARSYALKQAVAAEVQKSDGLKQELVTRNKSVEIFVEINAQLSNAVCNLTTLGGAEV